MKIMNIREITEGILYVGVNDRNTDRFEGLWPLPYGVSYNSYIVKGSGKIALIDSVEIGTVRDYINSIGAQIGTMAPDYLVVNHMEPDHSGGIPVVLANYPEIKIVGNRQTISMVKGFYHVEDSRFIEVKDGDEIDLGGKTLKFYLTPMVHWPETMMTYVI
ncbi:MAG: MBL fold metallo-hydrolase, partial [Muribaculaceae bacterium]|nr:MBL fold metallo-hydrolase [Muribaculaceae bacterium]